MLRGDYEATCNSLQRMLRGELRIRFIATVEVRLRIYVFTISINNSGTDYVIKQPDLERRTLHDNLGAKLDVNSTTLSPVE
jgi:hypothetical protein